MTKKTDAYQTVPGHLYDVEAKFLQKLAKGRRVLEIGTHHGRSAVAMAATAIDVVTVDHYQGDGMIGAPSKSLAEKHVAESGFGNITLVDSTWQDFLAGHETLKMMREDFDMIFYDGDHTQEAAFLDAIRDFPGRIAIHDYKPGEPAMKHVVESAEEYAAFTDRKLLIGAGSIVYFESE